jgi:hypothetical protein
MDEMERMRSDVTQLTRRIDDFSLRLAVVEHERKGIDEKLDGIREVFDLKMTALKSSVDGWNRIGFWLLTTVGSTVILAVMALVIVRPQI